MNVLVTGGSGFLGSHLADALSDAGHDVVVFDRSASPWIRDDQRGVIGDVLDVDAVRELVGAADVVYHLAGMAGIGEANTKPREAMEINVLGTLNVVEAARDAEIRRLVFASSIYTLSRSGGFYRVSKTAAEEIVREGQRSFGVPATILRFGSLYGPRADGENAIARLLTQALTERRIDYWGDGTEVREYIHVQDAAQMAVDVLAEKFAGQTIHLAGRERLSTRELLDMVDEMLGGDLEVNLDATSVHGHYRLTPYAFDSTLGRRLTRDTYIDLGLGLLDCMRDIEASTGVVDG